MKTIASVLVALSMFTGIAASLAPASAKSWIQELEDDGRFGHPK